MTETIALAGNPNAGKTTLFNALTGARQHVGNYPGVTVEKKEGTYIGNGHQVHIVDLPGTYSLTAYSLEEVVARDYLVNDKPAAIINIVDASNLERNLYLTVQFLELGIPVCIALNMMDVAKSRGIQIDSAKLTALMGPPAIPTVARTGSGKEALIATAMDIAAGNDRQEPLQISYGDDVDRVLQELTGLIEQHRFLTDTYPPRWIALKYIENDEQILELGRKIDSGFSGRIEARVERLADHLDETLKTYPEAMIADHRYGYIKSILKQGVISFAHARDRLYISDRIDQVVTNRFVGPLIMAAVVLLLYHFTFAYSKVPVSWCESFFEWTGGRVDAVLPDGLLKSLIISGVIDGVGGVLGFVPLIMFMFFGISLLEDSGYLARVAFMLDRVFRMFGLHGSSVMPFIVSGGIAGGCAVPGIMAARTLKSRRERLATLLTVPFMNCGAKLPVFALLVAAFFAENEALFMFMITVVAWSGALLVAKFLRITVIRGESTPFVLELPPYRLPTFKGLLIHTGERTWQYIRKAGTVILAISIVLWAMMTFPGLPEKQSAIFDSAITQAREGVATQVLLELDQAGGGVPLSPEANALKNRLFAIESQQAETALKYSIAGRIGIALETVSQWAGFNWRTNIALVGGFAAKEIIVATLGTAYSLGAVDPEGTKSLSEKLSTATDWRPLVALSLVIFVMFYSPCFVSVVCIAKEAGSWKWAFFSMAFNTCLAFLLAVLIFQIGSMLGF
ncbi:MAG: ferrous iron transport protein B [Candidatus Cloacimonadaceae bacterium]|jgi:ferrous iron transport protein B|nr:ferrous iron transport protein B [Candidatus Cloacimonadaceae bacterium]